jgi:hypothetical protein
MNSGTPTGELDSYLHHMKLRLINLRAAAPESAIFAFEGDEDKIIYAQWIRRAEPHLNYEVLTCKGKDGVLTLLAVVHRDLGNVGDNVYFFLDRDFDGLRTQAPTDELFVTDAYSVENYLVDEGVLRDLLKNEFHCHESLDTRDAVVEVFNASYDEFLAVTRELNLRIYVARQCGIKLKHQLPTKINAIAAVGLKNVGRSAMPLKELVVYFREPSLDEFGGCATQFEALEPRSRYRGKFALLFFQRWLSALVSEFGKKDGLFAKLDTTSRVRVSELAISNFASKSKLPEGLSDFLAAAAARQTRC